jgi:hypothetical protein
MKAQKKGSFGRHGKLAERIFWNSLLKTISIEEAMTDG